MRKAEQGICKSEKGASYVIPVHEKGLTETGDFNGHEQRNGDHVGVEDIVGERVGRTDLNTCPIPVNVPRGSGVARHR